MLATIIIVTCEKRYRVYFSTPFYAFKGETSNHVTYAPLTVNRKYNSQIKQMTALEIWFSFSSTSSTWDFECRWQKFCARINSSSKTSTLIRVLKIVGLERFFTERLIQVWKNKIRIQGIWTNFVEKIQWRRGFLGLRDIKFGFTRFLNWNNKELHVLKKHRTRFLHIFIRVQNLKRVFTASSLDIGNFGLTRFFIEKDVDRVGTYIHTLITSTCIIYV